MRSMIKFIKKIKENMGSVAIEYFVISAVITVGIINALYALRDRLIILINSITEILAGAV